MDFKEHYMTSDICYESFKAFEKILEEKVKSGTMDKHRARLLLKESKKNYKNQSLNRELDKYEKTRS